MGHTTSPCLERTSKPWPWSRRERRRKGMGWKLARPGCRRPPTVATYATPFGVAVAAWPAAAAAAVVSHGRGRGGKGEGEGEVCAAVCGGPAPSAASAAAKTEKAVATGPSSSSWVLTTAPGELSGHTATPPPSPAPAPAAGASPPAHAPLLLPTGVFAPLVLAGASSSSSPPCSCFAFFSAASTTAAAASASAFAMASRTAAAAAFARACLDGTNGSSSSPPPIAAPPSLPPPLSPLPLPAARGRRVLDGCTRAGVATAKLQQAWAAAAGVSQGSMLSPHSRSFPPKLFLSRNTVKLAVTCPHTPCANNSLASDNAHCSSASGGRQRCGKAQARGRRWGVTRSS
mmetsp:Transcript_19973/g.39654  ORF Transcript_19973/g.39654 Transcript_19973/m.39654 type:complete len:345 (+) Transcript_19973:620-1654(+)